jgi:hypothetical protein
MILAALQKEIKELAQAISSEQQPMDATLLLARIQVIYEKAAALKYLQEHPESLGTPQNNPEVTPGMDTIIHMLPQMDEPNETPPMDSADFWKSSADQSPTESGSTKPNKTVNDLLGGRFRLDLNDRLMYTKQLFEGRGEDLDQVLSQLMTLESAQLAHELMEHWVSPEYPHWDQKQEIVQRFLSWIDRQFD